MRFFARSESAIVVLVAGLVVALLAGLFVGAFFYVDHATATGPTPAASRATWFFTGLFGALAVAMGALAASFVRGIDVDPAGRTLTLWLGVWPLRRGSRTIAADDVAEVVVRPRTTAPVAWWLVAIGLSDGGEVPLDVIRAPDVARERARVIGEALGRPVRESAAQ